MRSATPELVALLNSSTEFRMADCLTIATASQTARYTSADVDVIAGADRFVCTGPLIKRSSTKCSVGLEVDSLTLRVAHDGTQTIEGLPIARAARGGALDGAKIELRRAFLSSWEAPAVGAILLFSGRVSDVNPGRTETEVIVKSDVELLNVKVPRNLFQPPCVRSVYSPGCGVQRGAFTSGGTVMPGATTTQLPSTLTGHAVGYFDQGVVAFTSGANAGYRRTVKGYASGNFAFALPLPYAPAHGDAFIVYPGCDKRQSTCGDKFNNLPRFKGFPYVPKPEVAA